MTCPQCAFENPPAMAFCGRCGTRVACLCPSCGFANPEAFAFCGKCGARVAEASTPPRQSPPAYTSPRSYTPKHLAEKILTSKAALEGERKQVTVLFADLKGSMELLADRDPEEARKLLDPVLEHMMEAVHRYEGTVNQVMGDGIMALFGAPLAHEDHAVRACYAALRMQASVKRYAEGVRREHGVTIRIRVGLNSGEVVVRAIGSDLHMDYTAVGQTTHLAARMEQLADPGSMLLTPDTLTLAEGFIQVASLGPMAVRGLPAPVEVYELTGVRAVRSRLQATAMRGLSRFVGRDAEIEQLRRALEQARQGRGQLAALVGEPGVGKSRLVLELTHSHRVDGWLVLEAGSVSYGKATSYLPVIDLLKAYCRIGDRDTYRDIREQVTGKLLTIERGLEPTLPALLSLLDVPIDDPQWAGLDPSQRRQRTLEAVKRLLLRETQAQPVLLVFEDLHWIDAETQALLDSLVESLPTARMLLLVSYRPEYTHGWGRKTYYLQLRLDPLPPESADELLEALLGPDASLRPLKKLLAEKTGGNPLFLEESVHALVDLHALVGEGGAYRLAQPVETVQVPATVQAILAARIDRLPPEEKRLLETAAVIGKDFAFTLLQAIADEPDVTLRPLLDHLQAAEFLYETSLFPDLEYTFKHALTHEVAYGSLLRERRLVLHARIVDAIERLYADRLAEQVERLAYHARQAERWDQVLAYCRQAGAKAAARVALQEAVVYFEQAVAAIERLPHSREFLEQSVDLRIDLRMVLFPLAEYARLRNHLAEGAALAAELGDELRSGRIAAFQTQYHWAVGETLEALACGRRALAIAERMGDPIFLGLASQVLGLALNEHGDYLEAIVTLTANVERLQGGLIHERAGVTIPLSLASRAWLAFAHAEVGTFADGLAHGETAVRFAESLGELYSMFHAWWALGTVHLASGDVERAARALERSYQLAVATQALRYIDAAGGVFAHAQALAGRLGAALALLEETVEQRPEGFTYPRDAIYLGDVYLRSGRLDDALRLGSRGLELARRYQQRGREAHALRLLGDIRATLASPADEATASYHEALALATELRMRPLVAHCHLGLGRIYGHTGKREPAEEHLASATTMYHEMGMGFWLEQAEHETQALG